MKKNTLIKLLICSLTLTFVMAFVFVGVGVFAEEPETTEAVSESTGSFMNWLKTLDAESIKAWLIGLLAKLGIDTALIFSMLIYFVRSKIKEAKTSQFYNDLLAKMDAEHKKEVEDLTNEFVEKLDDLQNQVTNEIKKANSEERKLAKENVEKMKEALSEINIELDK